MNYCHFNAEDFAADDYFKEWICNPNIQSDLFWESFYREYPEKYYALEEGKILVQSLYRINKNEICDDQVNSLWSRIEETVSAEQEIGLKLRTNINRVWQLAAMVLFMFGIGWLWYDKFSINHSPLVSSSAENTNLIEVINHNDHSLSVKLSDGSLVVLQRKSSIKYPKKFTEHLRTVFLKGNAFFEVKKDPLKPFLVYSHGLVTKVLGTSFVIHAQDDEPNITVAVKTGRVSVYSDKSTPDPETRGLILTPNQKAIFQKETAVLTKTLVEEPISLIEKESLPSFTFEDKPASEIFATLEKVYGIDVVFDEELMKSCSLTINLNEEDLFQKLEVICKVLDAKYKLIDAQVIIYSKGC